MLKQSGEQECKVQSSNYYTTFYPTRTYTKAQRVLEQYQHMPSFHSIQQDCAAIVKELKTVLKTRLDDQQVCVC